MNDTTNPQHYQHLPAEVIEIILAAIAKAPSNEAAYLHGQTLKYLLRCWEKGGVEDLHKAKWYLDRLVDYDCLAEVAGAIPDLPINEPTANPADKQPPSGYRMLGTAKYEPRIEGDQYWSLATKGWELLISGKVIYANRDNWAACRKIEVPPKQYSEPTQADLANGPIECEFRDDFDEPWRSGLLVYILEGEDPFLCVSDQGIANQWAQCRIEVTE